MKDESALRTLREVLADRLNTLMFRTRALDTQVKLAEASGVAQSTIGRILRCETSATLDNIESIARAFGIDASVLLRSAESPASGMDAELSRVASLPASERMKVAAFIDFTVNSYAQRHPERLSYAEETAVMPEQRAAVLRSASRPLTAGRKHDRTKHTPAGKRRSSGRA